MALVAFFILFSILSPATASSSESVVRRTAIKVDSSGRLNAQSGASAKAFSTKARAWKRVAKWQALREQLHAQHKLRRISEAGRNEALWYAVQEVDSKSHEKYKCQLQDGIAYVGHSMLHMPIIRDRRTSIQSARECALMCAADPLRPNSDTQQQQQRQQHEQCKSFSYNWTRQECSFFGVSPESPDDWIKDDCCTAGPPCNLQSMHVQMIQQTYEAELAQLSNHVVGKSMADVVKVADSGAKKKSSSPIRVVTSATAVPSNSSVAFAAAPSAVALVDASRSGKEILTMRLWTVCQRYQHEAITSFGLLVPLLAMFLIWRCSEHYFFWGPPSLKLDRQLQNDNLVTFAERSGQ